MAEKTQIEQHHWRISHQLTIAGIILLLPLLIVSSLYLTERNREITILDQQIQRAELIYPLHKLLQYVSAHRGLLNIYLNAEQGNLFLPLQGQIETRDGEIEQQLQLLKQRSASLDQPFTDQLQRISLLWKRVQQGKKGGTQAEADELFLQQGDIIKNLLQLLRKLPQRGELFPELQAMLTQRIPLMSDDVGLLRALAAGHMTQATELNHLGDGVVIKLTQEDNYTIRNHLTLAQHNFIGLRDSLEQTLVDGLERDRIIPLMYDLVSNMQELEDLIQWDILDPEEVTQTAEEFFQGSSGIQRALTHLADEVEGLYLHRIRFEEGEQVSSRNWLVSTLLLLILLAIALASTIVRQVLEGLLQAIGYIKALGYGEYDTPISAHVIRYNRSREIGAMFRSIERTRKKLQQAAEQTASAYRETETQKNFLNDLTNNMQNGVYALDQDGTVRFINPVAEQILGYRAEELLGKNIHEIIHSHLPDGTFVPTEACPVYKAINDGHCYHIEHNLEHGKVDLQQLLQFIHSWWENPILTDDMAFKPYLSAQ